MPVSWSRELTKIQIHCMDRSKKRDKNIGEKEKGERGQGAKRKEESYEHVENKVARYATRVYGREFETLLIKRVMSRRWNSIQYPLK